MVQGLATGERAVGAEGVSPSLALALSPPPPPAGSPSGRSEATAGDDIEMAITRTGRVRRRGASGEARRRYVGNVRGGVPHVWCAAQRLGPGGEPINSP